MKLSPGCNCCETPESCATVPLYLTSVFGLSTNWSYSGPGVPTEIADNWISIVNIGTGVTTMTPDGYLSGRANEAFRLQFEVREGSSGSDATITVNNGSTSLVVDLQSNTMNLNGRGNRDLGERDSENAFDKIFLDFNPERVTAFVSRVVSQDAAQYYEPDVSAQQWAAVDIDESATADWSADGFSIDIDVYAQIRNVSYTVTTTKWKTGASVPAINCGCEVLPITREYLGLTYLTEFRNNLSKLDVSLTGADFDGSIDWTNTFFPYGDAVTKAWGYSGQTEVALGNPADSWAYFISGEINFERGWWYEDANPLLEVFQGGGEFGGYRQILSCILTSKVTCAEPTAGDPYPMPQQETYFYARKGMNQSGLFGTFLGCFAVDQLTTSRDLTNLYNSFTAQLTLIGAGDSGSQFIPNCLESTFASSNTVLTFSWPGAA